ncbi:hypothetical protein D0809_23595 [Flavobacterium circumlabens]|uniref:KAP NTPase domain-containing protein n=1 Tax=Flavobacterium circumlabens TaxID=2133765 RepID=A0A4Y7U7M1_9FLAO|nr:hypothetical protein [Flavobacterium circumlabens]TCN50530.1 hypothetical protein EV142_1157 [Flavobacterium circumlabens]TEB41782.1 hypothetical protein D0809_23595 [Flavobacterium circumlabens]
MNEEQVKIVEQYLKIESNYAMIISGKYGTGKTHFYKNELVPMISNLQLPKKEGKVYDPIHISLFGYSSLEEIQTAILAELYPLLKDKKVKLGVGVVKALIKGFIKIKSLGTVDVNLSDYQDDLKTEAIDWIKFDELVICFDDIDRKSPNLDIQEVLGFINSLVENQGAKIIIIANEEELLNDEKYSSKLKEKVIGVTVHYTPPTPEVFRQIIKEKYETTESVYFRFLNSNDEKIIKVLQANNNNFRNLVFFLEHFKVIFKPLEILFDFDSDFSVLKDKKQQAVLDFTLAITMEYKLGHLNSTNIEDLQNLRTGISIVSLENLLSNHSNTSEVETKDKTYMEIFDKKYFHNIKYCYFGSITDYITGKKAFDQLELKSELQKYFVVENGVVAEYERVLQDLGYMGCLNLSNKEYRNLTFEMLKHADQGKYQLKDYSTVFHYASRFNNRLHFDLLKLTNRIKKGIDKGLKHYIFTPNLDFHLSIDESTEYKDEIKEIINYVLKTNNYINDNNKKTKFRELEVLFFEDFNLFITKTSDTNEEIRYMSFFQKFNVKQFYKNIKNLSNEEIWKLAHYFKRRYSTHMYGEILNEKDFITELLNLLSLPSKKREKDNLQNLSLNYLSKSLTGCVINFGNAVQ